MELKKLRSLIEETKSASPFAKAAPAEKTLDEILRIFELLFQQQHSQGGNHGSEEISSKTSN